MNTIPPPQQQPQAQPPQQFATPPQSGDEMLMQTGGGPKIPVWSWALDNQYGQKEPKPVGTAFKGTIDRAPETQQQTRKDPATGQLIPLTFENGDARWNIVLTLRTDPQYVPREQRGADEEEDDGLRRLFLKKGLDGHVAVRDAVRAAGAEKLEVGGELITWITGFRPNPQGGYPLLEFAAQYTPPAQNALMNGGQQQPVQSQAPVQPQPAQQQPVQSQAPVQPQPQAQVQYQPAPQQPAQQQAPVQPQPAQQQDQTSLDLGSQAVQYANLGMPPEQIAAVLTNTAGREVTTDEVKSLLPPF